MPIKWTAELDTVLLQGVFEECNISFSKALCNKLADRIKATGIECTAKAVEGRLYNWKKKNVGGSATTTVTTPASTPRRPKATPKSQRSAKKRVTPESDDSEAFVAESPSDGKKRKRAVSKKKTAEVETTSGEEEYIPFSKRVKSEPIEEMQMGFEERGEGEEVQEEV